MGGDEKVGVRSAIKNIMKELHKILLALLTGILVSAAFPIYLFGWKAPELGWLIWFALVPLFVAIRDSSYRETFKLSLISTCFFYLSSFFWVVHAMYVYGGLSFPLSLFVMAILVVVMGAIMSVGPAVAIFISKRWRGELIVWLAVSWTVMAFVRNYFPFGGFPWSNLAMSQWKMLPVIQIADLVGVYGVIFLIVWVNVFIAECVFKIRGARVDYFISKVIVTVLLIAMTVTYGFIKSDLVRRDIAGAKTVQLGMIQGNIAQDAKWEVKLAKKHLNAYRSEAAKLVKTPVDLIVWPEASFPWYLKTDIKTIEPQYLGMEDNILGTTPFTFLGAITEDPANNYHNSAVLLDSKGDVLNIYNKVHMVPFGEYVPLQKILFFLERIALPSGTFIPGTSNVPVKAGDMHFVPLICYEDIFPELSRKSVLKGGEFLLNITNNAWFGETSAPYQQLALSVFRAVENRRYLARTTNTGVSAIIDPTGKQVVESSLFEPATIVANVARLSALTIYTRLGDWFAWGCVAYMALGLIVVMVGKLRMRKSN